jgi:tetratricopeptide (TPR) repeat protein
MISAFVLLAALQAAVAAIKAGNHQEAITLLTQLFDQAAANHTTHPELFIAYSNKAACHLALGQYSEALQVRC